MSIGYIVECKGYIRVECACICDTTHSIVQCKSEKCERAFCPSDDNIYAVINIATVILVIMHASMQYRESQLIISHAARISLCCMANVTAVPSFLFLSLSLYTGRGCHSLAVMFSGPPTVQPWIVSVSWTAAGFNDPLMTGVRYALYRQCGAETTFQLIDANFTGLSYFVTTLPSLTQCVLRVVAYSDHCLLDVNGATTDTTEPFTTG